MFRKSFYRILQWFYQLCLVGHGWYDEVLRSHHFLALQSLSLVQNCPFRLKAKEKDYCGAFKAGFSRVKSAQTNA
jgi:hypothetical protein